MDAKPISIGEILVWFGAMCIAAVIGLVLSLVLVIVPTDRHGSSIIESFLNRIQAEQAFSPFRLSELDGGDATEIPISDALLPEFRFIVRFDPEAQPVNSLRNFRENRGRGRAMFEDWSNQDAAFTGFRLAGVMPSGNATAAQLRRQLNDVDYIIYADAY